MYAIKQTYVNHKNPAKNCIRLLKKRYKTLRNAENLAQQYRWICKPKPGLVTEESRAEVITI